MSAPTPPADQPPALEGEIVEPDWATADVDDVSAYTRSLISAAFLTATAERQAGRDHTALSMSALGGCTRAAAFKVAGWPVSNPPEPEEAREALLGTWLHEVLLPLLAQLVPDSVIEHPCVLRAGGLTIPGRLDLANPYVVWDLKTVKEWRLAGVRRLDAAYVAHWLQVMGYAYARYQAKHPVRFAVWIYFDRSTGQVHIETEEFIPPVAGQPLPPQIAAVIRRAEEIAFWARDPKRAPRELARVDGRADEPFLLRGPGPKGSVQCDRCEWLTECWGKTARRGEHGAQRILTATPAGIAAALAMYARGAGMTSEGNGLKDFAKLALDGVPHGVYDGWLYRHTTSGAIVVRRVENGAG